MCLFFHFATIKIFIFLSVIYIFVNYENKYQYHEAGSFEANLAQRTRSRNRDKLVNRIERKGKEKRSIS